jgi:hypothetical protein
MFNANAYDYILAYWMASDKNKNDWYMVVGKRGDMWYGEYTFRYHKDPDPHAGKDEKSRYQFSADGSLTEDEVIEKINSLFEIMKIKYNDFHDHFLIQGGVEEFMEIAKTKDYMHMKAVTVEETDPKMIRMKKLMDKEKQSGLNQEETDELADIISDLREKAFRDADFSGKEDK